MREGEEVGSSSTLGGVGLVAILALGLGSSLFCSKD